MEVGECGPVKSGPPGMDIPHFAGEKSPNNPEVLRGKAPIPSKDFLDLLSLWKRK
jgi:hypothetical protein